MPDPSRTPDDAPSGLPPDEPEEEPLGVPEAHPLAERRPAAAPRGEIAAPPPH